MRANYNVKVVEVEEFKTLDPKTQRPICYATVESRKGVRIRIQTPYSLLVGSKWKLKGGEKSGRLVPR